MGAMRINLNELRQIIIEAMLNAYSVLGVPPNASEDEIKRAWRALALQNHPDRGGSHGKMVDINNAKDRLLNKTDLFRYGPTFKGYEPAAPATGPKAAPPPPPRQPPPGSGAAKTLKSCPRCGRTVAVENGRFLNHYERAPVAGMPAPRKCSNSGAAYVAPGSYQQRPPPSPPPGAGARGAAERGVRDSYKVYGWRGGRRVVRVKGKLYGTEPGGRLRGGGNTSFNANDRAQVRMDGTRMKVTNPTTNHSQTWDPIDEVRQVIDRLVIEMIIEVTERA
jgi:hypothetical protein